MPYARAVRRTLAASAAAATLLAALLPVAPVAAFPTTFFVNASDDADDGMCDACTVSFGLSTDDEMFVLIGSYVSE